MIIDSEKFKRAKKLLEKSLDWLDTYEDLSPAEMREREKEIRRTSAEKFGLSLQEFEKFLAREKGESSFTESITGDRILDIKLKYNYTPEEIEFLKDHPLTDGKSWQEKLNDPEIQEFIAYRRRKKLEENRKQKVDTQKEETENPFK